jgi:translation initiation factor 6
MIKLSSYNGVEYIGVYCAANEELALVPMDSAKEFRADVAQALGVDILVINMAQANIIGSLVAMNSYGAVVSAMATDAEVEELSKHLAVLRLTDKHNAAGNNILCNDNGAVVNPDVSKETFEAIADVLQVDAIQHSLAGHSTVGSVCVATNKGVLCHPEITREEFDLVKSVLKVDGAIGTANYGASMVGACLIANSKGAVVGYRSTPIELGRIEDALHLF